MRVGRRTVHPCIRNTGADQSAQCRGQQNRCQWELRAKDDRATDYWAAVHPYSAGGAYVNMMMEEGDDRIRAAYRENYDRLARVKAQYDPTNLCHINQNISPAETTPNGSTT